VRRVFSLAIVALVVVSAGAIIVSSSTAWSGFQASEASNFAYFFMIDTSEEMASYLDSLKASVDQLIEATQHESNVQMGLATFNFSSADNDDGAEDLYLSLSGDPQQFREAVVSLTPTQTANTLNFALEHVIGSEFAAAQNLNACLVIVTHFEFENVDFNVTSDQDSAALPIRFALINPQQIETGDALNIRGFDLELLTSNPAELYEDLVSYCSGEAPMQTERAAQPPEEQPDSETAPESDTTQNEDSETQESADTEDLSNTEAVLQRHTADIELLKQNVSALSALLSNVPVLERLQQRLDEQAQLLSDSSVSISELDARLSLVEAFAQRLDQIEVDLGQINVLDQQLGDLESSLGTLDSRLMSAESALNSLPISDHQHRLNALEQSTAQISGLQVEIAQLTSELGQLRADLESTQQSIDMLPFSDINGRIDGIDASLQATISDLTDLSGRVGALEADSNEFSMKFNSMESRVADVEAGLTSLPISEIESNITMLGSEVRALNDVDDVISLELQRVNNQLGQFDEVTERISSNEAQIEILSRLIGRVDNIESTHREFSRRLMTNSEQIEAVEAFGLQLSDTIRAIQVDLEALQERIRTNKNRASEIETRHTSDQIELLGKIDVVENGLNEVHEDLSRLLQSSVSRVEYAGDLERLNNQQQAQDTIDSELSDELAQLKADLRTFRMIFVDLNEETRDSLISDFTRDYRQLQNDVQQLRSAVIYLGAGLVISALAILYLMQN